MQLMINLVRSERQMYFRSMLELFLKQFLFILILMIYSSFIDRTSRAVPIEMLLKEKAETLSWSFLSSNEIILSMRSMFSYTFVQTFEWEIKCLGKVFNISITCKKQAVFYLFPFNLMGVSPEFKIYLNKMLLKAMLTEKETAYSVD